MQRISSGPAYTTVGKTNMDEFGMGSHSLNSFFGPARIPAHTVNSKRYTSKTFGPEYSVGGSSGGSALAVKTGQSRLALGTDTGGSVRLPAAYVGVVGFKPSYGLVSRFGVVPYANSLDTVGMLGHTVRTVSILFDYVQNHDPQDPTSLLPRLNKRTTTFRELSREAHQLDLKSLTVGVPLEYNIEELHPTVRSAWTAVLQLLQDEGCTVVPVSLPTTKHALSAYYVIAAAEAMSNLAKYDGVRYGNRGDVDDGAGDVLYSSTRGQGFGDEVRRRILLGSYTLSSGAIDNYFLKAQRVRRLVQKDFDRIFKLTNPLRSPEQFDLSDMEDSITLENKLGPAQVDFIITPTAPTPPPKIKDLKNQSPVDTYMNDVFTVPASLAGVPAISIPVDMSDKRRTQTVIHSPFPENGKIAGVQIVGQYLDDWRVIHFARRLENLLKHQSSSGQTQQHDHVSQPKAKVPEQKLNVPAGRVSRFKIQRMVSRLNIRRTVDRLKLQPLLSGPDSFPTEQHVTGLNKTQKEPLSKPNQESQKSKMLIRYLHFQRKDQDETVDGEQFFPPKDT
ncbi:Glutamyl-tRNA(Gln) amidotransferase subunit A, mitochondrial [Phlyctema vagabunda]|uniref:Glutamyl-tRNA(Gln) amidotransferase subunit A, mitochondrial n=1 Tax=Phlyctema vagabunda TaxID=108571 RepID=A0ABR4P6G3_9HELO